MGIVSIAVMIMAVTLVVLAAAILPAFLEIRKTAVASRETLERIEADLRPVLKELHETLTDLNLIVHDAAEKREDVVGFMEALGDTGRGLRTINGVVGSVAGILSTSSIWVTGAKVAGKYAVEKFLRKRRKSDGEQ
jgi:uncharacterized protein YoxC